MEAINSSTEMRKYIVDFLQKELIGPNPSPRLPAVQPNGEEILRQQDPPRLRYSAGVLFPQRADVALQDDADEQDIEAAEPVAFEVEEVEDPIPENSYSKVGAGSHQSEESVDADQEVNLANQYLPSAMGVSALVRVPETLKIEVSAGIYEKKVLPGHEWINRQGKTVQYEAHYRTEIKDTLLIDDRELLGGGAKSARFPVRVDGDSSDLELHVLSRPRNSERERLVTFTLVNRKVAQGNAPQDRECFFQCAFSIENDSGETCFLEYPERPGQPADEEEASLRLLYRHKKVFAVGHGCAAKSLRQ